MILSRRFPPAYPE